MATDHPWQPEPIDLAPEVVLLPGFDGDGADPFLVPVNALLLGGSARLLVVPGVRRAPWTPALARLADQVRWIVSARPTPTRDLRLALARCRRAVPLDRFPAGEPLAAGRFALLDPPTSPVRSRAVHDVGRRVLYGGDGFGAPVLLPVTDADDLDDAYWAGAAGTRADVEARGERFWLPEVLRRQAELAAAEGAPAAEVAALLDEAIAVAEAQGEPPLAARARAARNHSRADA